MIYFKLIMFMLALAGLDRMRGTDTGLIERNVCKLLMGLAFLCAAGRQPWVLHWQFLLPYLAMYFAGASYGWGTSMAGGLLKMTPFQFHQTVMDDRARGIHEFYCVGPVTYSWVASLACRGLLWGALPGVVLAGFGHTKEALWLVAVHGITFPLSMLTVNRLENTNIGRLVKAIGTMFAKEDDKWAQTETWRGLMVGAGYFLIVFAG